MQEAYCYHPIRFIIKTDNRPVIMNDLITSASYVPPYTCSARKPSSAYSSKIECGCNVRARTMAIGYWDRRDSAGWEKGPLPL